MFFIFQAMPWPGSSLKLALLLLAATVGPPGLDAEQNVGECLNFPITTTTIKLVAAFMINMQRCSPNFSNPFHTVVDVGAAIYCPA